MPSYTNPDHIVLLSAKSYSRSSPIQVLQHLPNGTKMVNRSLFLTATLAAFIATSVRAQVSSNIEMAARMNVAENLCDVNYNGGGTGLGGVVHYTMMAASELKVSIEAAAALADARHRQIVTYLNEAGKLDEFCQNARAGKL